MYLASQEFKQWFAVIAKPRQDRKLARFLEKCGQEFYIPIIKQKRQWSDRLKTVEVPILSPYLFIKAQAEQRAIVFESGAAAHFVHRLGKLAIITEDEINTIRRICHYGVDPVFSDGALQCGEQVKVTAGIMKGLHGRIIDTHGRTRFYVKLESIDCWASVSIEKKYLQRIE